MPTYYYGIAFTKDFPKEEYLKITKEIKDYIEDGIGLIGCGDINTISSVISGGDRDYWFFSVTMNPVLEPREKKKLKMKNYTNQEYCEVVYGFKKKKLKSKLDKTVDDIGGEWKEFNLKKIFLKVFE
jgi:hypothetical protein